MYALVDCNNFYVSCERVFDPSLIGKPVIVLSNNDGCAISRSDEAKTLGIEMGAVPHLISDKIDISQLRMFSSNYVLYGDMSDRVMKTLATFVPRMEIYSIDEAFLDLSGFAIDTLYDLGCSIKITVGRNCRIPVCIGIGPTKALAKMANRYAKKTNKQVGVYCAIGNDAINNMLEDTAAADVWNIGHQYSLMLQKHGIKTAKEFADAPPDFIRKNMTVQGLRLQNELNGIPCFEWEFEPAPRKGICVGRSFGFLTADKKLITEALSNFVGMCAVKLREQKAVPKEMRIFLNTNPHRPQDKQWTTSITMQLEMPTNSTPELIKYAIRGLDIIFKEDHNYMKCGIEAKNLVNEDIVQSNLFSSTISDNKKKINGALDQVNKLMGRDTVRFGIQGFQRAYKARAAHLSRCYTTRIEDIIKTID